MFNTSQILWIQNCAASLRNAGREHSAKVLEGAKKMADAGAMKEQTVLDLADGFYNSLKSL